MSNVNGSHRRHPPVYPLAPLPASALDGVRRRRMTALAARPDPGHRPVGRDLLLLGVLTLGSPGCSCRRSFPSSPFSTTA